MADLKEEIARLRAMLANHTKAEATLDAAGRDAEMPVVFAWRNARTEWWDALLASAPALLDAAERGADDGLKFGPPDRRGTRHAVAPDGEHYAVEPHDIPGEWFWSADCDLSGNGEGHATSYALAEAAAHAHDRARRSAK